MILSEDFLNFGNHIYKTIISIIKLDFGNNSCFPFIFLFVFPNYRKKVLAILILTSFKNKIYMIFYPTTLSQVKFEAFYRLLIEYIDTKKHTSLKKSLRSEFQRTYKKIYNIFLDTIY